MESRKENVLNLKRLLIGVLVGALLLTMVSFDNIGSLVAKAEVTVATPKENVLEVTVGDVASFQTALSEYEADLETHSPNYSNGVVITLSADLDFSTNEILVNIPTGDIYILLDGYSMYGCASLQFVNGDAANLEYLTNMYISGSGSVQAGSMDVTTITDWEIPAQIQVSITSEVGINLIRFCVGIGGAALVGDKDLINTIESIYNYILYNSEEGLYKYKVDRQMLYIEELSTASCTGTSFDMQEIKTSSLVSDVTSYVYSEKAIQAIPADVTLTYDNGIFVGEYENPGVSLIADEDIGLYHASEDGTSMTIYAIKQNPGYCNFHKLDSESVQLQIFRDYQVIVALGGIISCKNVTFALGAIPVSYTDSNGNSYNIQEVIIYPYGYTSADTSYERNFTNFEFDLSNFTDTSKTINVFNRSGSEVTLVDNGNANLYVTNPTITLSNAQASSLETVYDSVDSYQYVKAGDVLTLTPDDGYTIYDIQLGDWIYNETDSASPYYSYDKGRRAEINNIVFNTDGTVEITVPNFTASVAATVGEISETTIGTYVEIDEGFVYKDVDNGIYWYDQGFTIGTIREEDMYCEIFQIMEEDTDVTGVWGESVSENEEGIYSKRYYIIDKTVEQDFCDIDRDGDVTDYVPSSTYGKIMYLDYSFGIDTTAPEIFYTDANKVDSSVLKSDAEYEGNLYFTVEDAGSGIESITLYENVDGTWTENAVALVATEAGYYIASTNVDKLYRIVVVDVVGNERTYDNLTLKAYAQDIQISLGETTAAYGSELVINLSVKNIGQYSLQISKFALQEGITDTVFDTNIGTLTNLDAGETFTTTIKIPAGTNVGRYKAVLEVDYESAGDREETTVEKICSYNIVATITKSAGTAALIVKDFYYGETVTFDVTSTTNDVKNAELYYKDATDDTAEFSTEVPTEVGNYEVKVVLPATEYYNEVVLVESFKIIRMSPTTGMYVIAEATGKDKWYVENVVIKATDGHTLCTTENGSYTETLILDASTSGYTFYVKTPTGAITSVVALSDIKVDKTAPEIAAGEGIYAVKTWWKKFLETITFNLYEAESTQIEIKAHDNESDVAKISYYVSETAMSLEAVASITNWTEGSQLVIYHDEYEQFVVYAKIENNAGLVTYLSTDGIQLKVTEPEEAEKTIVIQTGTVHLKKGTAYQTGSGTWNVSGDSTNYAGGITFYVSKDGDYNFMKK